MRMRETVSEWVPEERMVLVVDNIEKQPIKQATMTLTLSGGGDTTSCTMSYDYEPKGGPLAFILRANARPADEKGLPRVHGKPGIGG
jgi:hypothetical protein